MPDLRTGHPVESQGRTIPGVPAQGQGWWQQHRVWQAIRTPTPYACDQCGQGDLTGERFVATAMGGGYQAASVICPQCRWRPLVPKPKKRKPSLRELPE